MESTRVIKVKYGDTLRRFTARVNENNHLDLDMAGLKAKILSLFNLTADANLVLKYVDEDGDLVTLVDDDDLHDMMRQRLKFLRIDVHISNEGGGKSNASSSGSATPLRSPGALYPGVEVVLDPDALKSVPEPLREALSKFTTELLSYSPVAACIIDGIFKMGFPVPSPHGQAQAAAGPSSKNGVPEGSSSSESRGPRSTCVFSTSNVSQPLEAESVTKGGHVIFPSLDEKALPEPLREALHKWAKARPTCGDSTSSAGQQVKADNVTKGEPVVMTYTDVNSMPEPQHEALRKFHKLTKSRSTSDRSGESASNPSQQAQAESVPRAVPVVIAPDALKSVPAPLREAVSKLTTGLLSSSPEVAKIVDSASKMALSILNSRGEAHAAAGPSSKIGAPEEACSSEARGPRSPCGDSTSNASQRVEAENDTRAVPFVIAPDALKSVPEQLREAVSKFSIDLLSSSPAVANLVDSVSKVRIPGPYFQAHVAAGLSSQNGVTKESVSSEAKGPQPPCVDSNSDAGQQVEAGSVTRGVVAGAAPVDLNNLPSDSYSSQFTNMNTAPLSPGVPESDGEKGKKCTDDSFASKGESSGMFTNSAVPTYIPTQMTATSAGASNAHPFPMTIPVDFGPDFGPPVTRTSGRQFVRLPGRSPNHAEARGMFHKRVRCDGCGVYPITGPRFQSKVKENYDLCSICFNDMGNESDYIRMDRPVPRAPQSFTGVYEHPPRYMPHAFKADAVLELLKQQKDGMSKQKDAVLKHAKPKLDSRFILDVNVIDGTMMAPSTAFTKIWRMRNSGTLVWPKGTQLVWIGGDPFSDTRSVYLEVPEGGVPVDKELDIAVDFRAPQLPGRYVSYWRMASPSGQIFGQRVWVLIQVDASLKDSFYDGSQGLNLNIPLDVGGSGGPQIIDINAQPIEDDVFLQHLNPDAPTEPVNPVADKQPRQELGKELPIYEAAFVGPAAPAPATSAAPSSVSYPIIDLSETAPAVPPDQQSSAVDTRSSYLGKGGNNPVEETLLKELEEMGFRQVDLNKEILRMNEYNLEQSVDDLCGVSEWDPILEELQEMGFRDNEMNKRLLKKNNGSIKRVVMDLINGEKNRLI